MIDIPPKNRLKVLFKRFFHLASAIPASNKELTSQQWRFTSLLFLFTLLTILSSAVQAESSLKNSPVITSMVQDEQGFIWLASLNGLTRYSGESNIIFNSSNENWPLPFNWINDVFPLKNNQLLLATETHQLWLFDTKTGSAKKVNANLPKKSIYDAIKYKGSYYLNIPNAFYQVDSSTLAVKKLVNDISIKALKKTKNNLYISTHTALYQLINNEVTLIIDENISAINTTEDTLIVATKNKLMVINDNGDKHSILIEDTIHAIAQSHQKENAERSFFTINNQGVIKKYASTTLKELTHTYPNENIVKTRNMLHDSSGVLWLITNQGVTQVTPQKTYNHKKIFDVVINGIELTALNDELIIGSYGGGLGSLSTDHPILAEHINRSFSSRAKIITDLVTLDTDLYIATFDGLWRYNSIDELVSRVDFQNNNNLIIDTTLKGNLLYIATNSRGFLIFDIAQQKIIKHIDSDRLSADETINLLPLDNGEIWIANTFGIDIYNTHTDTVRHIKTKGQNKVISLVTLNNKIFVATKGDGIFVYNTQGEMLSHFAKKLSFGYIAIINNNIWAPAQPGLYKINPDTYQMEMLPHTEQYTFTDAPLLLNDTVYIGHYGGVLEVPLTTNKVYNPKVYISKTIVSGKSYLLNKTINVNSPNDVITLELASLDYRPGQEKQYKYQINNGLWNTLSGNTLTLTGLASGMYNIEIIATNSLGQWSENSAFTEVFVAYPWYWTPHIRIFYGAILLLLLSITCWLLYLRAKSISHVHHLLNADLKIKGKNAQLVSRNLTLAIEFLDNNESTEKTKKVLQQSIEALNVKDEDKAPDSLYGNSLLIALPFFSEYVHKKYHINLTSQLDIHEENLTYEMQADIYKIIYEAITSAILNSNGRNFKISMQEFKGKLWLTINDDSHSFANVNNKINFDMAMYYIRQIATKYKASVNTFDEQGKGSQLVISIPLMKIS